ncbi:cysteine--tRNA ligase, partial [bacterium 1XD42-8]
KLSHKKLDDLEAGHREMKVTGDDKEDSFDFVLWKPKKEGEPFWHSPWCDGRPGWHIECSAMSRKYLGEEIDIHAGGEDLIFPHHENEIAQSEGANGKTFAKYWMHNGFLNIDNKKMSKSLGNFFTVRDVNQKYDPQVLRFFMLSAHYRSPLNFSEDLMEAAKNGLSRIVSSVENLRYLSEITVKWEMSEDEKKLMDEVKRFRLKFEEAMDDDFNTADAVSVIFELVKFINIHTSKENSRQYIDELVNEMEELTQILGIITKREKELLDQDIEDLINERQVARKEKNFQRADEIREELSKKGILLEDTREGVKWKRID